MKIREIKPITFLYFRTTTTFDQLHTFVGTVQAALYKDALAANFFVSGPPYWTYFNFTDMSTPFDLEIGMPIQGETSAYAGQYQIKTTGLFRCLTYTHEGDWLKFGDTYALMMEIVNKQKLSLSGESRECYINIDFKNPDANITEIQIGLQ